VQWASLSALPAEVRSQVLAAARRRRFAKGMVVFHEGDSGDSLFFVESGRLAVRVTTEAGETLTLSILRPGETFGELALIRGHTPQHRTASVIALEHTETLSLSATAFDGMRAKYRELDDLMLALLAERVDQLGHRLLEALYVGVNRRVYRRLVELAEIYDDGSPIVRVPLTQDDLAGMAGASRPTVNQVLQALSADGAVTLGRGSITIENLPAIQRRTGY
jgi:CRP-like cAMP-binding protein